MLTQALSVALVDPLLGVLLEQGYTNLSNLLQSDLRDFEKPGKHNMWRGL
jgi:hypothetical protein